MRLMRLARNIAFDLRYGAFLGGVIATRYENAGAVNVANSDYAVLPYLFNRLIEEDDVLVDVGCGKGRVLNWWLRFYQRNRIVGIELDSDVAENTRRRLRGHPQVTVYSGNVLEIFPEDGTFFYLFNPFDRVVMRQFLDMFFACRPQRQRKSRKILYYNCVYKDLFVDDVRLRTQLLAPQGDAHPALLATEVI
jgi:SAM-dependent methyltransferase